MFVAQALERSNYRRKDPDWIARRMRDPASFFVAVWKSKILVTEGEAPGPVLLKWQQLEGQAEEDFAFFLGERNGNSYFAVDVDEKAPDAFDASGRFQGSASRCAFAFARGWSASRLCQNPGVLASAQLFLRRLRRPKRNQGRRALPRLRESAVRGCAFPAHRPGNNRYDKVRRKVPARKAVHLA